MAGVSLRLAGCGSDEETSTTAAKEPSTTASAAATSTEAPESPLDGTWRTSAISPRDAEATLRQHGLAKWIKPFRRITPIPATTTLILEIDEDWDLYTQPPGDAREETDYDAEYVVRGEKVDKIHSTGTTTYRWSVEGDTLTFEWLKTTEPPSDGIPDEVYSRVLYMTKEFKRQD